MPGLHFSLLAVAGKLYAGSAPAALSVPAAPPAAEVLLYDFAKDSHLSWREPTQEGAKALIRGFPHPHAAAGARCDPNSRGTPAAERLGGILLPRITQLQGAFTRPDVAQTAYLLDYCPSGVGQPRTRRLLIFEKDTLTFDHELSAQIPADEILHAADVNGDGIAEVLLTASLFRGGRNHTQAVLLQLGPGAPQVLGTWVAVTHCIPSRPGMTARRIYYRTQNGTAALRSEAVDKTCHYPPAPPPHP